MRNKKRKPFLIFLAGIGGILVGAWMIFYLKDIRGFIPGIIGVLLLIIKRK